jgi:glycine cleavage system H protein
MNVQGYEVPDDLLYTKEHEWAKQEGAVVRVGITDYAAKTLNDVVYVTAPKPKSTVSQFASMGTVESIKAVSELYSPLSGTVVRVNEALDSHPELVNRSPYGEGWIIEVEPSGFARERTSLMGAKAYGEHLMALLKK